MNFIRFRIPSSLWAVHNTPCLKLQNGCYNPKFSTSSTNVPEEETEIAQEEDIDLIMKKRNKSRMRELYHTRYIKKELGSLVHMWDYKPRNLKKFYATYGKNSGLNPGIMWPTKEELQEMIEFEREFETPVQDMIRNIEEAKRLEKEKRRKREQEVFAKVAKLGTWIKELKDKEAKKLAAAEEQRQKRERLIEEVQEYLGYNISPRDPKFQEVLEQKELEEKKAKKAAKKKDKHDKMLEKLLTYVETGVPATQPSGATEATSKTTAAPSQEEKERETTEKAEA